MRKGQAAVEFLMSYGWAILIVLVVIGALAYFGVLNPVALVPERCLLETGLECKAFMAGDNGVSVLLQNNAGRDMRITSIAFESEALTSDCTTGSIDATLKNGEEALFYADEVECAFTGGRDKNKYAMTVTYSWTDANLQKVMNGEMVATKAEAEVATGGYGGGSETLIAHWAFDASGSPTPDETGNHPGTVNGGAAWQGSGCHKGGCYTFDGNDDYISAADSPSLEPTSEFTISAWVYADGDQSRDPKDSSRAVVWKNDETGYMLDFNQWAFSQLQFSTGETDYYNVISGVNIPNGEWVHVVVTRQASSTVSMYINGAFKKSGSSVQPIYTEEPHDLRIGTRGTSADASIKGSIDEVKLWSKALTPEEITAEYNR